MTIKLISDGHITEIQNMHHIQIEDNLIELVFSPDCILTIDFNKLEHDVILVIKE